MYVLTCIVILIQVISPSKPDDPGRFGGWQDLEKAIDSTRHYTIRPELFGLNAGSPELFGMFTHEIRVAYKNTIQASYALVKPFVVVL